MILYIPMSKFDLKQKAFAMRKNGESIKNIAKILNISKSTASIWCRDIILSIHQKNIINEKMRLLSRQGSLRGAETNKRKKFNAQKSAEAISKEILGHLTKRDKLVTGIALYWAEGSKSSSSTGFIFVNSDPSMILFMYNWLVNIMKISRDEIVLKVSINAIHQYRIEKVLNFWSNLLDLPRSQFSNTFYMRTVQKKVYENQDNYYGVLRLSVKKSTFLKYKTLSLIGILKPV